MTFTISSGAVVLLLLLISPALCTFASVMAERIYTREHRKTMAVREKLAADVEATQDEWGERLAVREMTLDDREEAVISREQQLRRSAKEASAAMNKDAESFDTMISVLDADDFPHPFENADTIALPPVEDER